MCFFSYLLGFVTSDWQGIDWISSPPHSNYSYSVQAGVGARIDMINIMIIGLFENPLVDLGLVNQLGSKLHGFLALKVKVLLTLYGDYEFTGKLARAWFRTVDQLPMNVMCLETIMLFSSFDGVGDVTKAELLAFIHRMQHAWDRGMRHIVCQMDGLHIVDIINAGVCPTHHPHASFVLRALELFSWDWTCVLVHIRREANSVAH
ncbi:Beta-D-glucosidase protein [Spatholobus suberectus]|nr:Beta-D-glucosidase protein [Spatholobus suberectus]